MTINVVERIDDAVKIRHVLAQRPDKRDSTFSFRARAPEPGPAHLLDRRTFSHLENSGPDAGRHLTQVSDYTGQPETQGGLVKTRISRSYLGLLTETYNDAHQADLQRTGAWPSTWWWSISTRSGDHRQRRCHGRAGAGQHRYRGPCMIRASAKNFIRMASVVDPADYPMILAELKASGGAMPLALRFRLAQKAFAHTAEYDRAIAEYLGSVAIDDASRCYRFV
jgi:phosphoribosylaminoimidazolecarboxamide formyltransferase/IMP cyclohydrolase